MSKETVEKYTKIIEEAKAANKSIRKYPPSEFICRVADKVRFGS